MVELTIDTARDSPEEIRRVIRYLQSVVGEAPAEAQPTERAAEQPDAGLFNLFGESGNENSDDASDDDTSESRDDDSDEETVVSDDNSYIEIVEY